MTPLTARPWKQGEADAGRRKIRNDLLEQVRHMQDIVDRLQESRVELDDVVGLAKNPAYGLADDIGCAVTLQLQTDALMHGIGRLRGRWESRLFDLDLMR